MSKDKLESKKFYELLWNSWFKIYIDSKLCMDSLFLLQCVSTGILSSCLFQLIFSKYEFQVFCVPSLFSVLLRAYIWYFQHAIVWKLKLVTEFSAISVRPRCTSHGISLEPKISIIYKIDISASSVEYVWQKI